MTAREVMVAPLMASTNPTPGLSFDVAHTLRCLGFCCSGFLGAVVSFFPTRFRWAKALRKA